MAISGNPINFKYAAGDSDFSLSTNHHPSNALKNPPRFFPFVTFFLFFFGDVFFSELDEEDASIAFCEGLFRLVYMILYFR